MQRLQGIAIVTPPLWSQLEEQSSTAQDECHLLPPPSSAYAELMVFPLRMGGEERREGGRRGDEKRGEERRGGETRGDSEMWQKLSVVTKGCKVKNPEEVVTDFHVENEKCWFLGCRVFSFFVVYVAENDPGWSWNLEAAVTAAPQSSSMNATSNSGVKINQNTA